ncbi:hypothetical protein KR054_005732, partial [Drosophila jambulina]
VMSPHSFLFLAFIAFSLHGSLGKSDLDASTVCQLQDPKKQCGEFCLAALKPLINHIALHQQQWNIRDAVIVNETQAKLSSIEGQQAALKDTLAKNLSQELEVRLESIKSALDSKLLNLQKTLSKIERKMILQNFNKIGSKYFYVEHNLKRNWESSITTCSQMGGHLASIDDASEFDAIVANLKSGVSYRVDINDLAEKGQFMSNTSGKKAAFLKWKRGEPRYDHELQRCVTINDGGMWVDSCKNDMLFICQANEEE